VGCLGPCPFVSAATGEGEGDPAAGQTNTRPWIGGGVLRRKSSAPICPPSSLTPMRTEDLLLTEQTLAG